MFGLGKHRSKYGRFMDRYGIKQEDVRRVTGYNKDTITKAFNEDKPAMRGITRKGLVEAAKELTGRDVKEEDFW